MSLLPFRTPVVRPCNLPDEAVALARIHFMRGQYVAAFDMIEYAVRTFQNVSVPILVFAYDLYQKLPDQSRYGLYQSRLFDFSIQENDSVLDMGSGNVPFPLATHLADISTTDGSIGRAGEAFKHVNGKPVYECDIEHTPFHDKQFDFVYCSHVLEHAKDPAQACRELMRIARRGYIETPTRGKDTFLNTAVVSNHLQYVELVNDVLTFTPYKPWEQAGLEHNILLSMHCDPQTDREKAFSALLYLKARCNNTMLLWEDSFEFCVQS